MANPPSTRGASGTTPLTEILDLGLGGRRLRCAGQTQGNNRCHNIISFHNRGMIALLLAKWPLTKDEDTILHLLAPILLCQRFHQYQAAALFNSWRREVAAFNLRQLQYEIEEIEEGGNQDEGNAANVLAADVPAQQPRENQTPQHTIPAPDPTGRGHLQNPGPVVMALAEVALPSEGPAGVIRKPIDDECTICYDPLNDGRNIVGDLVAIGDNLPWCQQECGTNFHRRCLEGWRRTCADEGNTFTCPNR